jgi:hypothetical protein
MLHTRPWGLTMAALAVSGLLSAWNVAASTAPAAAATSATAPAGLRGCAARNVPGGFLLDESHSGTITSAQYSASGDIQASLIFDHYRHGERAVYTALGGPSPRQGGDLVIECVAMKFSTPVNANRFLQSFEYLRAQAASIVKKVALPARLPGDAVGYREEQQAFSGYHISSTTVMELADQHGDDFYDVSVAGPDPLVHTAFDLLKALTGRA